MSLFLPPQFPPPPVSPCLHIYFIVWSSLFEIWEFLAFYILCDNTIHNMPGRSSSNAALCQFFFQLIQGYGMFVYCLSLGVSYPTDGGCTSLYMYNGVLPNQNNLDLGWWFEVYGAVGLTWTILSTIILVLSFPEVIRNNNLVIFIFFCAIPLACTTIVFFVLGNVWFFHFTPATTFSDAGSGGNSSGTPSNSGNTPVPAGGNVVNGGGVINDGLATNCQWLSQNGYWMMLVQWIIFAVSCCFYLFINFFRM